MNKMSLKNHFLRCWMFYVIWIAFAVIFTQWIIGLAVAPAKEEKISLFLSQEIDGTLAEERANEVNMPGILEVEKNTVPSADYLLVFAEVFLKDETDIAVITKADADSIMESYSGVFMEADTIESLSSAERTYYEYEGKKLGIKLDGYSEEGTECYMFISSFSVHIGAYCMDACDSYAIDVALSLLGE